VEFKQKAHCNLQTDGHSEEDYNLKRHYVNKYASKCNDLEGHLQSDELQRLKFQLSGQQSLLLNRPAQAENSGNVSYLTVEKSAKHGKPFGDREFVKACLRRTVDIIYPPQSLKHQFVETQ
jgi:hypothetical protein